MRAHLVVAVGLVPVIVLARLGRAAVRCGTPPADVELRPAGIIDPVKIKRTAAVPMGAASPAARAGEASSHPLTPPSTATNFHPLSPQSAADYLEFLLDHFEPVPEPQHNATGTLCLTGLASLRATGTTSIFSTPGLAARAAAGRLRLREDAGPRGKGRAFITAAAGKRGFPVALGQFLALQCDHSYRSPLFPGATNPAVPPHPFVTEVKAFDRDHAQGFGFVFEKHAFLVFRGSESGVDWVHNLRVRWRPEAGGDAVRVHKGFQHNLDLLWPEIETWQAGLAETHGVILSGHSLGGAMATLAAHRLSVAGQRVTCVITFGSPRPGNRAFAESYERLGLHTRTWRVVWGGDLVTALPPWPGYRHVGRTVPIGSPRQLERDPIREPLSGRSNAWWRMMSMLLGAGRPWVYAALSALPYVLGLAHSGREHMRALGYSRVHRSMMDRRVALVLEGVDAGDQADAELLARMHRAYFTGEL